MYFPFMKEKQRITPFLYSLFTTYLYCTGMMTCHFCKNSCTFHTLFMHQEKDLQDLPQRTLQIQVCAAAKNLRQELVSRMNHAL